MIDPVIFRVGFIQVTWYALVYIFGFLAALFLLLRASSQKKIDITEQQTYDLIILAMIGLFAGARIFHILFWDLNFYISNPIKIFYIWEGGLSFHGGLLGALITVGIYTWIKKINFWKIADLFAFLGVLMPVFSRIANFINQEIVGTVTDVSWCVNFKNYEGCRHPVQLYASAGRLVYFFFLLWMSRLKKYNDGFIFWNFIFFIGLGRFFLDFIREGEQYFGLLAGQWFSLAMVLIGGYVLVKRYEYDLKSVFWRLRKSLYNKNSENLHE